MIYGPRRLLNIRPPAVGAYRLIDASVHTQKFIYIYQYLYIFIYDYMHIYIVSIYICVYLGPSLFVLAVNGLNVHLLSIFAGLYCYHTNH